MTTLRRLTLATLALSLVLGWSAADAQTTINGSRVIEGDLTAKGQVVVSGDISPTQLAANTDDWNPTGLSTASTIRVSTDASRNLTGIQGGADGRVLVLHNVGSNDLVLKNDVTSTAANRFLFGADVTLAANKSITLQYDATSSRWRAATTPGSGAGGLSTIIANSQNQPGALTCSASEQDMFTYSMPGGTLTNGRVMRVYFSLAWSGINANITPRFYLGATALSMGSGSDNSPWVMEAIVLPQTNTSTYMFGRRAHGTAVTQLPTVSSASDISGSLTVKATIQCTNTTGTITPQSWKVVVDQ
jgi:hypothetical protein